MSDRRSLVWDSPLLPAGADLCDRAAGALPVAAGRAGKATRKGRLSCALKTVPFFSKIVPFLAVLQEKDASVAEEAVQVGHRPCLAVPPLPSWAKTPPFALFVPLPSWAKTPPLP